MIEIEIQNIDAIELFKTISDNSIDLIVTDPPYPVISGGKNTNSGRPSGILKNNDGKIFKENNIHISKWIYECYRVLKDNSHLYIMINFLNLEEYMKEIRNAGFDIHSLLMWEKDNCTPSGWYMKNGEYVIFARKGKAKRIKNGGSKMIHRYKNPRNKIHPTEKPVDLIQLYIENSSNEGDLVLDPFVGGGSCPLACKITNRNFIGSELDINYFTIAKDRINSYVSVDEFIKNLTH
jgi:site-specific DNA-methyltransferase (adenine-specific)